MAYNYRGNCWWCRCFYTKYVVNLWEAAVCNQCEIIVGREWPHRG